MATITEEQTERVCKTDGKILPVIDGVQKGWYCCDEYYCSQACLNQSFDSAPDDDSVWLKHYDDDGDCYYTEWED